MKRVAAALLFALLFAGGFRPMFLRLLVSRRMLQRSGPIDGLDRRPLRDKQDPTPAELKAFLQQVREQTRPGETIGIHFDVPYAGWSYAYWRANYILSGRRVLLPGNLNAELVLRYPPPAIERRP